MNSSSSIYQPIIESSALNSTNNDSNGLNVWFWVLLFFILSVLGFNIFFYLAEGTTFISNHLSDNINLVIKTIQQIIHTSAVGAKASIDVIDTSDDKKIYKSLSFPKQQMETSIPKPVQGKAGWCFVGKDRNVRSCSQIGVNDQCMSGDIFPTQQICVNPNLR